MREKLNNDPKTQVAAVVLLVVIAAFFFISKSGGGEEEEATATEATGAAVAATPGEAVDGAIEETVEGTAAEATTAPAIAPGAIETPPPPKPVTAAYEADQTVVLLIVHDGGIDDRLVARSVRTLSGLEDVAVFVVPAKQIYRYASITLGTEVSRVPALVVLRPRKLSKGGPEASVSYGFRDPQSVRQAVEDASYKGPELPYHPN